MFLVDVCLLHPKTVLAFVLPLVTYWVYQLLYSTDTEVEFFEDGKKVQITPVEEPFDWKITKPKAYRPFKKGKYNMTMGLKKVAANEWLLMEDTYNDITDLRAEIVEKHRKHTVLTEPVAKDAVYETYDMMVDFMVKKYGKYFVPRGKTVYNMVKSQELPRRAKYFPKQTSAQEMIRTLARNIEEDFLIMMWDEDQQMYYLRSGSFAFPSGFDPAIKLNMALRDIHGPVPMYQEKLEFSMDRYFSKLKIGQWVERANWTVQTHEKLYAPSDNHVTQDRVLQALKAKDLNFEKVFLRVERQLLMRLPITKAIVFTIRTYKTPLSQIRSEGRGLEFVEAINALPDKVAHYKKRPEWGEAVTEYLSA